VVNIALLGKIVPSPPVGRSSHLAGTLAVFAYEEALPRLNDQPPEASGGGGNMGLAVAH